MSAYRKQLNIRFWISATIAALVWLLIASPSQAQLNWASMEYYQSDARLLHYQTQGTPTGTLLIWPEFKQTHRWLPIAQYWQQRGWQVLLLKPDQRQQQFNPSSEQVPQQQTTWLTQLGEQLSALLPKPVLVNDTPAELIDTDPGSTKKPVTSPLVVIAQGSSALWYQQLVDGEQSQRPQALILFDALPQQFGEQKMLAISLARSPYPILDIYSRPDNPLTWHNQQGRQQQLSQREKAGYAIERFHNAHILNKQIAGWLVRLGWLPLPPSAPQYLKEQYSEAGISRSKDTPTPGKP